MSTSIDVVFEQALSLSDSERTELVQRLIESLDADRTARVEATWAAEASRRLQAYDEGKIQSFPADEVFAALRKKVTK